MGNRDFSDSIKLEAIKTNLKINNGDICCATCGKRITSIQECHFDHIMPFAKGGKSSADNCQILCVDCNLKKNDKELQDFLLEEKAKRFLAGGTENEKKAEASKSLLNDTERVISGRMTKEVFDKSIESFINRKGDIHKVDFGREYNNLPSIHYVNKYYGDLKSLKKAFGIEDLSANWNRDTIKKALVSFIDEHGDIVQKDLTTKNSLPSLPCVLKYYPEYKNFTDIKKNMLNLAVRSSWDKDSVIQAGKNYVARHGKITESNLRAENNLPTAKIVYTYFDSMADYQKAVGSIAFSKNEFISEKEIQDAVDCFFEEKEREIVSMKAFFAEFPISPSTIHKRYGSFSDFCQKNGINVRNSKKAKYTKQEVDDAIADWVKKGNPIPRMKDLSKLGLPSQAVILRFYENWKEPFVLYKKLYDKLKK